MAIRRFDEGIAAYLRRDYKDSIKKFTQALKHEPNLALAYSSRGAAHLKSGYAQKAISDFNRAIRLNPNYARAHHLRGLAYEQMGDFANAYLNFDRALEIDPDLTEAYRKRDCVVDKSVDDCIEIEDLEMADHLAAMRIALFTLDQKAAYSMLDVRCSSFQCSMLGVHLPKQLSVYAIPLICHKQLFAYRGSIPSALIPSI
jgi:tetratricopeptide (TPR) repeat protein